MTTENTDSNLPETYNLIVKTRAKVSKLPTGHIPAKDLLLHYVLPLFATFHDELNESLDELADMVESGPDDEAAGVATTAIINLANFLEKVIVDQGLASRAEGNLVATEKTPPGFLEKVAELSAQVVGALEALSSDDGEDPEEGDEEDDEDDEDEDDEDGEEVSNEDAKAEEAPAA